MNNTELLDKIRDLCEEAGVHYLVQIDDGEHINGIWHAKLGGKLHSMIEATNKLCDHVDERKY